MKRVIAFLVRIFLATRYKIRVHSNLSSAKLKSTLILPNHPAEIDPVIVSTRLWHLASPRPVVLETVFNMPVLRGIFRSLGAIPMPDMEQGSGFYKRKRIRKTLADVIDALKAGHNVLMYPSGRLSLDGREIIGGASGTYSVLQEMKSGTVLLVRTRGLWGSRFSKAHTGGSRPDIGKAFLSGLKTIFRNFIFLVPKRPVQLHVEQFRLEDLRSKSLGELNSFLEQWYAAEGPEDAKYVSDSFLRPANAPTPAETSLHEDEVEITPELRQKVLTQLAKASGKSPQELQANQKLSEDLGLDSLAIAELITWLHDELERSDVELAELKTVNSVFHAASTTQQRSPTAVAANPHLATWLHKEELRPSPTAPVAENLAEAFIKTSKAFWEYPACSDDRAGVLSYKDLLTASLVFREAVSTLRGKYVGILLPASVTTAVVNFACILAGKIPVFLNWTAGPRALEHAVQILKIENILSAGPVLDSITQDLSSLEERFVLLEELRNKITPITKLRCWLQARLPLSSVLRLVQADQIPSEEAAAVLFTSGSEAAPKGVPLSHSNILENIRSISEIFEYTRKDVMYGFLPAFHSFGLTVTMLMPLLCGTRVHFFPNPNESRKLAQGCGRWRVSLLAGTPAFLRGVLSAGEREQFRSLRILMSGADRLNEDVRELCRQKAPQAALLEGYGITECSPVVCAQRPGQASQGVGPPLPRVKLKIVDLDEKTEVAAGERGLVFISGPNVFNGYLGQTQSPFIDDGSERWYNSGDLGQLQDGSLVLSGRLKRFVKIGGEMISLPALEQALQEKVGGPDSANLAIVDSQDEQSQRPLLTLFSTLRELNKEKAQEALKDAGFPALVKLHDVRHLPELPLLGSGKTDIQALKAMLK